MHPGAFATSTANAGAGLAVIQQCCDWAVLIACGGQRDTPCIGCGARHMARLGKQIDGNDRLVVAQWQLDQLRQGHKRTAAVGLQQALVNLHETWCQ